jgi:hypothetical protein
VCYLPEASALRNLSHKNIDRTIEYRAQYFQSDLFRLYRTHTISDDNIKNLHTFCDFLLAFKDEFKLVIAGGNWLTIYTNNLQLLDALDSIDYIDNKDYRKVLIDRPRDTIKLKNPIHTYRSYFKETAFTEQQKDTLKNFLSAQEDSIRVSPGLVYWLQSDRSNYCMSYLFVDYSNDHWITMLSLVHPGLVRKTLKIIQDK